MSNRFSIVSILIAFVVVTRVQNGPKVVRSMPQPWLMPLTPKQQQLSDGVCKRHHWTDLWFSSVKDGVGWTVAAYIVDPNSCGPGAWKRLRLIPQMMGCHYGVKFYWFLSLAVCVIDECSRLSRNNDGKTSQCWNELAMILQGGAYTMLEVMRSLAYTHSTIGDDTIGLDVFYQNLSAIRNFLCTVLIPEGNGYLDGLYSSIEILMTFLTFCCRPAYPRLNMDMLMNEGRRRLPGGSSYEYFIFIMRYYMDDVSAHLARIGFHYDNMMDQTHFICP